MHTAEFIQYPWAASCPLGYKYKTDIGCFKSGMNMPDTVLSRFYFFRKKYIYFIIKDNVQPIFVPFRNRLYAFIGWWPANKNIFCRIGLRYGDLKIYLLIRKTLHSLKAFILPSCTERTLEQRLMVTYPIIWFDNEKE